MHTKRIAVVTGGNRGIGLEVCLELGRDHRELTVMMTARDPVKGHAACEELRGLGYDVMFRQLDVTDEASIANFRHFAESELGRWDILINNAGMLEDREVSCTEIAPALFRRTMELNVVSPLLMSQAAVPLMRKNGYGRIVNVSSDLGAHRKGLPADRPAYRISKVALNAMTRVMANELKGTNILINAVEPGWVRTDMGGPTAPRSVEEGSDTIVFLATLPDGGPTGGLFFDRQLVEW